MSATATAQPIAGEVTHEGVTPEAPNTHSGRTGRRTEAEQPKAKKVSKPKAEKLVTTPLGDVEAEMVAELTVDPKVKPEKITKAMLERRFRRFVKLTDEGKLRFYTAERYGSKHNPPNEWISPALVARIRKAVTKERPTPPAD